MAKTKKPQTKAGQKWIEKTGIVLFVACLIAVIGGLLFAMRNESFYSADKDEAHSNLVSTLKSINLPSQPIYKNLHDEGCTKNTVGLAGSTSCELTAQQYYRSQGNIKKELKLLNKELQQQGWQPTNYSNASDDIKQQSTAVSAGDKEGSSPYKNSDKHAALVLYVESFASTGEPAGNAWIEQLIKAKKIDRPTANKSIYGFKITKTYWSCSSKSLFELPCPLPPSEPK